MMSDTTVDTYIVPTFILTVTICPNFAISMICIHCYFQFAVRRSEFIYQACGRLIVGSIIMVMISLLMLIIAMASN